MDKQYFKEDQLLLFTDVFINVRFKYDENNTLAAA